MTRAGWDNVHIVRPAESCAGLMPGGQAAGHAL
jgi:hypothetical protein